MLFRKTERHGRSSSATHRWRKDIASIHYKLKVLDYKAIRKRVLRPNLIRVFTPTSAEQFEVRPEVRARRRHCR